MPMMRYQLEQSDETLVTHSGLALVGLLLSKANLRKELNEIKLPDNPTPHISNADIVLRSNNVDFALHRLIPEIENNNNWRSEYSGEGLLIRLENGELRSTGDFRQVEPLDNSPLVDRDLVGWKNYAYENGNFLQTLLLGHRMPFRSDFHQLVLLPF